MKYICIAPDKEVFNVYGESLGMESERALYYCSRLGKSRVYRSSYPISHEKSFKLFEYTKKEKAQELCDEINEVYNDDFQVIEIN